MGNSFEFQDISATVTVVDTAPRDGFVFTPGTPGPAGRDLRIDGTAPTYAALTEIAPTRIGEMWQTLDTGRMYTWTTDGWPDEEDGHLLQGPQGERGRGITSLSIDGDVLVADMSSGDDERVTVPAITAAAASAAAAELSASRAETNRVTASGAASAASASATRAEDAATAAGNAESSVNDAAGRAEVARDQAEASAEAAATDAAEVGDAREYVSTVHESWLPGGDIRTGLEAVGIIAMEHATHARDDRDAAAASATAAHGHANRAEVAADGVDQVVSDAAGVLAGELADDLAAAQAARTDAEAARDQAVGAASTASTKAGEAAASATLADGRATDAEGAVASIAAHATDAEDAAGRAAASESNAAGSATAAQGHADRAATEAGTAAQIAAQEKIAALIGDAPSNLDTIYELAAAFADRGDAISAIQDALANRVVGNHSSVISATIPGAGTPTNQVTFVVEGE